MPIDTKTLKAGGTPATTDGRSYPPYLKTFERYDEVFLPKVKELDDPTLNQLALEAPTDQLRSAVSPWIASAEWRLLITRVDEDKMVGKRRYQLTKRGEDLLPGA